MAGILNINNIYKMALIPNKTGSARIACSAAFLFVWVMTPVIALAQQAQPAAGDVREPNWEVIRKNGLTPIDRQTVQTWLTAQIDTIFSAESPTEPAAGFFRKIVGEVKKPDTAAPFTDALGQMIAETFVTRYQKSASGNTPPAPLGPVFILMTLREMGPPPAALPAFRAALSDPAPAVRCQGMTGLNALRTAVPAAQRAELIREIQTAATAETNDVVLRRLYAFLEFIGDNPAQPQEVQTISQGLTGILESRLSRIEKEGGWPTVADAEAVTWLAGKFRNLNAQGQTAVVQAGARLLADAAHAYANRKPPREIKTDLERIVLLTEDQLGALYKAKVPNGQPPSPSVADTMLSGGTDLADKVAAAVARWIGSEQTKGVLVEPFGLTPGLNIQRSAQAGPTTAPTS